jgi:mannose-6-phosphate isomerase-like protein (cupin superfamily)
MKMVMAVVAALALGAPTVMLSGDKALVIKDTDIKAHATEMIPQARPTGSAGDFIARYGNLGLEISVRTASGVGELHNNFDDLMIVQEGRATLVTGGSLVDPKPGADGEVRGTSVAGGESKSIGVGDVVIVPAGVPHQILLAPGTVYKSLVAKIKEK